MPAGALSLSIATQGLALRPSQNLQMERAFGPFSICRLLPGASPQAGMASRLWRLNCCETKALKGRRPGLSQPGAAPHDCIGIMNRGLKARLMPVLRQSPSCRTPRMIHIMASTWPARRWPNSKKRQKPLRNLNRNSFA